MGMSLPAPACPVLSLGAEPGGRAPVDSLELSQCLDVTEALELPPREAFPQYVLSFLLLRLR